MIPFHFQMADRSRRYRERKREKMGEEAFKEWQRDKKREKRKKIKTEDPVKYDKNCEKDRERKAAKKLENATITHQQNPNSDDPDSPNPAYSTKQGLARGVKKVTNSLPTDTPKKVAVLSAVVKNLSPSSKTKVVNSTRRKLAGDHVGRPSFDPFQKKWIVDYLKRPNISYTCPGRRDSVYMGKNDDGTSEYHPRHYLLWFLSEIVLWMNSDIESSLPADQQFTVSYGSLWRLIKPIKYLRYRNEIPENTCTCETCENLELLLLGVKNIYQEEVPTDTMEYLEKIICSGRTRECVEGKCGECCHGSPFFDDVLQKLQAAEEVAFYKWGNSREKKYPEKKMHVVTGIEAAEELKKQTSEFKRHNYSRMRQHSELTHLKATLVGTKSAIIQVDFSENYTNTQQNEIQSAYFGHDNFSLYTVCVWFPDGNQVKSKTFCIISDNLTHSKFYVLHYNKLIIQEVRQIVADLQTVHFWSDGCAAQFKSRFCFYLLSMYPTDLRITWNFFESHHGKGPVDGVGGRIKTSVYSDVKGTSHDSMFQFSLFSTLADIFAV